MSKNEPLENRLPQQLLKDLAHLEFSIKRTQNLSCNLANLTEEELEKWEGLVSRFSRLVDLFTNKFLRFQILKQEPAFRGSTKDWLNQAEKLELIDNSNFWFEVKELSNKQAHEYEEKNLENFFLEIRVKAQEIVPRIKNAIK